jgi:hypothetical protein
MSYNLPAVFRENMGIQSHVLAANWKAMQWQSHPKPDAIPQE